MIIYGTNSYLLKSISPSELGVRVNVQPDTRIEYRQRYFHLFFIPFFPIGRLWSVRQGGKLYHASAELEQAIQHMKPGGKHGVWAWSGPLLGIAVYFIVTLSNNMDEKAYKNKVENNRATLAAFFQDTNKTTPLKQKLNTINSLIDSSLSQVKYEDKTIDTSENELLGLYLEAHMTHSDTLTGYNKSNTLVISDFPGTSDDYLKDFINSDCKAALEDGNWKGYSDTTSVFAELHKLEQYKYILLLKEYNRVEPRIESDGFATGYSFVQGTLLSIETGKTQKNFKLMATNSEKVSHYSMSRNSSSGSSLELKHTLESDLKRNVLKEANKYVFGAEL